MAKKKDVNVDELDEDSGKSGKFVSILVAILIIAIWLVIFALLIKMNVGGVGSMLRPYLKNVPVISKILPDPTDEEIKEENGNQYKNLSEAVDRIKELEAELDAAGYQFSSANSINIGRLVPQIVYYVYAYASLVRQGKIKDGQEINVVVPTGNFGNILAAYYAKQMGLPVHKLICASNDNKVLYDFFRTGTYDRKRDFILTTSPSMDILISSNLERLIYRIAGNDAEKNKALMQALNGKGAYTITDDMKKQLADFYGNYASEAETAATIKRVYESDQYIMDTHTAVAASVYDKYVKETGDTTPTVIASTASPYKFTRSVMNAIDSAYDKQSDFELVDELNKLSGVKVPQAIEDIRQAEVRHDIVCDKEDMLAEVKKFLNI